MTFHNVEKIEIKQEASNSKLMYLNVAYVVQPLDPCVAVTPSADLRQMHRHTDLI